MLSQRYDDLKMHRFFILIFPLLISACTSTSGYLLTFYANDQAAPERFEICHGYSCRYKAQASLPQSTWKSVQTLFIEPSNAAQEREKIAQAIALLESEAGKLSGIKNDLPKSVKTKDTHGQQDCIDETVNTTTYLRMLQTDKLLRWHEVSTPVRRGYFVDSRWPHNSAAIKETLTGQLYAVDSWPRANGELPDIKPVALWYREGRNW